MSGKPACSRQARFGSPLGIRLSGVAVLGAFALMVDAGAAYAQPVVQPLPTAASAELSEALQKLSRDPDSITALVAAGSASLELGNMDAAAGFFDRARQVSPDHGSVLAGLAHLALAQADPVRALGLFDRASINGEAMAPHMAARGMAYDLVGENARAQGLYGQALATVETPEVIRQLALSYAIAGDIDASEATILPLLQRSNLAAFRTRAFALAIRGKDDEAVAIAETMLPARISSRLTPYLRVMTRLTRAQQAAAANFGRFPRSADIGRDTPQITAFAMSESGSVQGSAVGGVVLARAAPTVRAAPAVRADSVDSRLIPSGDAFGPAAASVSEFEPEALAGKAPDLPVLAKNTHELPALTQAEPAGEPIVVASLPEPAFTPEPDPEPVVVARLPEPEPAPVELEPEVIIAAVEDTAPRPSFSLSQPEEIAQIQVAVASPSIDLPEPLVPAQAPPPAAPQVPQPQSLAEAFADFGLEEGEADTPTASGAVDITSFEPTREDVRPKPEPEPEPEPKTPDHPRRIWVQVATGADTSGFRYDWRRIRRNADGLLENLSGFYAPWQQTNRLVTGPFSDVDAAQKLISDLKEQGVDSFRFTSSEGEEVTAIP